MPQKQLNLEYEVGEELRFAKFKLAGGHWVTGNHGYGHRSSSMRIHEHAITVCNSVMEIFQDISNICGAVARPICERLSKDIDIVSRDASTAQASSQGEMAFESLLNTY